MESRKLQKLTIDWGVFKIAFDRDADFHDAYPQSAYMDRRTGEIIWFFDDDKHAWMETGTPAEENQAARQRVESMPDQFLKIPGLSHGEHHEILKEFLDSDWIDNDNTKRVIRDAYFGSIGGWIHSVDESTVEAFYEYKDHRLEQMREKFLRSHGIEPNWK